MELPGALKQYVHVEYLGVGDQEKNVEFLRGATQLSGLDLLAVKRMMGKFSVSAAKNFVFNQLQ